MKTVDQSVTNDENARDVNNEKKLKIKKRPFNAIVSKTIDKRQVIPACKRRKIESETNLDVIGNDEKDEANENWTMEESDEENIDLSDVDLDDQEWFDYDGSMMNNISNNGQKINSDDMISIATADSTELFDEDLNKIWMEYQKQSILSNMNITIQCDPRNYCDRIQLHEMPLLSTILEDERIAALINEYYKLE